MNSAYFSRRALLSRLHRDIKALSQLEASYGQAASETTAQWLRERFELRQRCLSHTITDLERAASRFDDWPRLK